MLFLSPVPECWVYCAETTVNQTTIQFACVLCMESPQMETHFLRASTIQNTIHICHLLHRCSTKMLLLLALPYGWINNRKNNWKSHNSISNLILASNPVYWSTWSNWKALWTNLSVERQKDLTTSHLHTQLDPFAS